MLSSFNKFLFVVLASLVTAFFLLSCASEDDPAGPTPTPMMQASGTVGASGGTLTSDDGKLSLTIPAGALAADTEITVTEIPPDEASDAFDGLVAERAFKFEPQGLEFAADVERLKRIFSTPRTPQQEREMARTITSEASRMMSEDEASREWLDGQLTALEEASDPREIDARVNVTLELWKAWEVSQLAKRHNVPPEMMQESGLTMSPEAASYVPQAVTQGVGITPSP